MQIEELEEEETHFGLELVQYVPFAAEAEAEEEAVRPWKLERVSNTLAKELDQFVEYRSSPINRQRDGTCVVEVTVGADKRTVRRLSSIRASALPVCTVSTPSTHSLSQCLAFLGYLSVEHGIQAGMGCFAKPELSGWAEAWLRALEAKGLRYSTVRVGD